MAGAISWSLSTHTKGRVIVLANQISPARRKKLFVHIRSVFLPPFMHFLPALHSGPNHKYSQIDFYGLGRCVAFCLSPSPVHSGRVHCADYNDAVSIRHKCRQRAANLHSFFKKLQNKSTEIFTEIP